MGGEAGGNWQEPGRGNHDQSILHEKESIFIERE